MVFNDLPPKQAESADRGAHAAAGKSQNEALSLLDSARSAGKSPTIDFTPKETSMKATKKSDQAGKTADSAVRTDAKPAQKEQLDSKTDKAASSGGIGNFFKTTIGTVTDLAKGKDAGKDTKKDSDIKSDPKTREREEFFRGLYDQKVHPEKFEADRLQRITKLEQKRATQPERMKSGSVEAKREAEEFNNALKEINRTIKAEKEAAYAAAGYRPPHVLEINNATGIKRLLLTKALGDDIVKTVNEIAFDPNKQVARIELKDKTTTLMRPPEADLKKAAQAKDSKIVKADSKKEDPVKEHPDTVRLDLDRVLTFKITNASESSKGNKLVLEALDSVKTGVVCSKPYVSWSETPWSEMGSYVKSKGWGSLNKITIAPTTDGKSYNGVADVFSGPLTTSEDVPFTNVQFIAMSTGLSMLLNSKRTDTALVNPNYPPRLSSN